MREHTKQVIDRYYLAVNSYVTDANCKGVVSSDRAFALTL